MGVNVDRGEPKIFACRAGVEFGKKICSELNNIFTKKQDLKGFNIGNAKITQFADTEVKVEILENVRDSDVFLVQSISNKALELGVNENFMELLIFTDALKRAKAARVIIVSPNMPYSRQDKQKGREPITAKLVAKLIETSGADGLITIDLHADQVAGFYDISVDNLHGSKLIIEHLKSKFGDLSDWVFASPDAGGAARAEHYAKKLNAGYAISSKRRNYSKADTIEEIHLLGDVKGKKVCIVDDIISSAGTMANAAREIHKKGASEIYSSATHALFNTPACERLSKAHEEGILKEVICLDTITHEKKFNKENKWFTEISAAPLLAKAIMNINRGLSVSKLYE